MDSEKKVYEYRDSSGIEHSIEISKKNFTLKNKDESIHDLKLKSKPTTFFKDALKRFRKNKSSVTGAIILGLLLLLSVIVPLVDTSDIVSQHPNETFLEPKLFPSGTGFWDGTKKIYDAPCDLTTEFTGSDGNTYYYPNTTTYPTNAISNLSLPRSGYVNAATSFAKGGFMNLVNQNKSSSDDLDSRISQKATLTGPSEYSFDISKTYDLSISFLDEKLEDYSIGDFRIYFTYLDSDNESNELLLKDYEDDSNFTYETLESEIDESTYSIKIFKMDDIFSSLRNKNESYSSFQFCIDVAGSVGGNSSILIKEVIFSGDDESNILNTGLTFTDSNASLLISKGETGYWSFEGVKSLYHAISSVCDFTFDTYEATYGVKSQNVEQIRISEYIENGWISEDFSFEEAYSKGRNVNSYYLENLTELGETYCPIVSISNTLRSSVNGVRTYTFVCEVSMYKYLGYTSMPIFLMGTDGKGYDLFKQVFVGLRNSLLLGVLTFAICFCFGLVFGAICGYYGGTLDLVLQRFVDILSGVPWIVIMTLCILHLGSNFWTFILAMCMTGWIGTSSLTRTQFYRFRDREYTLASRTLGAKDKRLIFRHILPNAMGTIITSSVLMIPSVVFSEATISYLGLGFKDMESLGVILSNNQTYLSTYPHLIIFPSIVMALIMISFNLFGNGLRDAFNPSLKGSE